MIRGEGGPTNHKTAQEKAQGSVGAPLPNTKCLDDYSSCVKKMNFLVHKSGPSDGGHLPRGPSGWLWGPEADVGEELGVAGHLTPPCSRLTARWVLMGGLSPEQMVIFKPILHFPSYQQRNAGRPWALATEAFGIWGG